MNRRSTLTVLGIVCVVTGSLFSAVAWGQVAGLLGQFSPFVVDIHQAVPVVVSVPVEVSDGETMTATVPLTVSVALQVRVDGQQAAVVSADVPAAEVVIATATPAGEDLVDSLGYPYRVLPGDENIALYDWEVFIDSRNYFSIAGRLENQSDNMQFSLVDLILRFYRADGSVLAIETPSANSRWIEPGEDMRFEQSLYVDISKAARYEIIIDGADWRE